MAWGGEPGPSTSKRSMTASLEDLFEVDEDGDTQQSPITMENVLEWMDTIPLPSRPKGSGRYHRDFADGKVVAEILALYFPKLVHVHNYSGANGMEAKRSNWQLLRRRVIDKIGVEVSDQQIDLIIKARQGGIESVLIDIYERIMKLEADRMRGFEKEKANKAAMAAMREEAASMPTSSQWIDYSCVGRIHTDGREEIVVCGKLVIHMSKHEELMARKEEEISSLRSDLKQQSAQVKRLQMLVNLKEEHLMDLTKVVSSLKSELEKLRGDKKSSQDARTLVEGMEDIQLD